MSHNSLDLLATESHVGHVINQSGLYHDPSDGGISIQSPRLIPTELFAKCLKNKLYSKSSCRGANKFSANDIGQIGVLVSNGRKMGLLRYLRLDLGKLKGSMVLVR
jgi:hypothetical protein